MKPPLLCRHPNEPSQSHSQEPFIRLISAHTSRARQLVPPIHTLIIAAAVGFGAINTPRALQTTLRRFKCNVFSLCPRPFVFCVYHLAGCCSLFCSFRLKTTNGKYFSILFLFFVFAKLILFYSFVYPTHTLECILEHFSWLCVRYFFSSLLFKLHVFN